MKIVFLFSILNALALSQVLPLSEHHQLGTYDTETQEVKYLSDDAPKKLVPLLMHDNLELIAENKQLQQKVYELQAALKVAPLQGSPKPIPKPKG